MRNHLLYIGIILLLVFLLFDGCNKRVAENQSDDSVSDYLNDTISYYENKLGQEVAHRKAIQGDVKAFEIITSKYIDTTGQLRELVKNLKKVDAAGNITQVVRIDSLFVPYSKVLKKGVLSNNFYVKSQYYSIYGSAQEKGVLINKLEIPNTLSFAIGKTKGLFNSEYRIEVVNSNPKIKTIGLDSYTFKAPKKRIGIGLQVGYGIGSDFTIQPYIGIGVSYNFIRF